MGDHQAEELWRNTNGEPSTHMKTAGPIVILVAIMGRLETGVEPDKEELREPGDNPVAHYIQVEVDPEKEKIIERALGPVRGALVAGQTVQTIGMLLEAVQQQIPAAELEVAARTIMRLMT